MHIKYLEERTRAGNRKIWVVNPPKYVREAIGADYEQFDVRSDAVERATFIAQAYSDYKRGARTDIRIPLDTVDGLISFYKSTNEYKKLSDNSKRFYGLMVRTASEVRLGQANVTFGEMLARNVSPTHTDKLFETITQAVSEHRAVHVCKVMRKVWFVGKRHGRVQNNPFERMGLKGLEDRTVLWEPAQVDALIAKADEMGLRSIGTITLLCYHLCQRPGDMRQLKWKDFDGRVFSFVQEKTKTRVEIPASPQIIQRLSPYFLDNEPDPESYISLCETTGKPYDRFLYMKYFSRVRAAAGLPAHLQLRDLRRTGATEMAEAGCTEDELRSVTGHLSRNVLSIYVRPTTKLAASGINKRFGT
jgi:integrase